jgi:hypothetical protein
VTAVEPQGPGWAFALFAAAGQELGPVEVQAVPRMAQTVSAHSAILRAAVTPGTAHTGVFAAETHPAAHTPTEATP